MPLPFHSSGPPLFSANNNSPNSDENSGDNNDNSDNVVNAGHLLDAQPCCGTPAAAKEKTGEGASGGCVFRVHVAQSSRGRGNASGETTDDDRHGRGLTDRIICCYSTGEKSQQQLEESCDLHQQHQQEESDGDGVRANNNTTLPSVLTLAKPLQTRESDLEEVATRRARTSTVQKFSEHAEAHVLRSLEVALRERENDLKDARETLQVMRAHMAEGLQREEDLRNKLLVSEETRVLYQLYLQRLLELLRTHAKRGPTVPHRTDLLVTNNDVVAALSEALHSTDTAADGDVNVPYEFFLERRSDAADAMTSVRPSRQLTNATLLKSSMLESTVADCMALWRREEKRQHDTFKQILRGAVNACREEMEAKHVVMSSVLKKTEQRVSECGKVADTTLKKLVKKTHSFADSIDHLQQELKQIRHEYAQAQRHLQRAQAEICGLKDELQRRESDREVGMLMHRATECLEEVRQSVRSGVRSAAHDIERRALESNTLKEPFIQSIRLIALKVEAHAEVARMAVCRERRERADDSVETLLRRSGAMDTEEVHRFILSTPREGLRRPDRAPQVFGSGEGEGSRNLILDELARVMKNLCQLLENNLNQMARNAANVTRSIALWEAEIVKKMNDIWEYMRGVFAATSLPPTTSAPFAIGDSATDYGGKPSMPPTKLTPAPSASEAKDRHVDAVVSGDYARTKSASPSGVSFFGTSHAPSTAPAVSWRAPLAPPHETQQTPNSRARCGYGRLTPPSIAVSRTPTPPATSLFLRAAGTLPPTQRPQTRREEEQQQYEHQPRQLFSDALFSPSSAAGGALAASQIHCASEDDRS